jgi:prepilin-type N-terminal cleavage/methylation domain-containing protein/prepilin-type processing-associated H-X9-DG protein
MKKAFTLIELLVVIAIIAILAAILFPVFAQAKMAAKKTADLSNMKQITLSNFMYDNDYDDTFPMIIEDPVNWSAPAQISSSSFSSNTFFFNTIVEQLAPYIKNQDIWQSPEDTLSHCTATGGVVYTTANKIGAHVDYIPTYNGQQNVLSGNGGPSELPESYGVFGNGYSAVKTGSLTSTQLPSPADLIIFCPMFITWSNYDGWVQYRNDQRQFSFSQIIPSYPEVAQCANCWCAPSDALSMESFNGQTNWAFGDGHAKSMPRQATMDPTWYTNPAAAISGFKKNLLDANAGYN